MSQSNYKEELRKILDKLDVDTTEMFTSDPEITIDDALAAIDRLNAAVIGENEKVNDDGSFMSTVLINRNELRSKLRQAFGVGVTDKSVGNIKEDK